METPEEMYSRLMTPPSAVGFITLDDVIKLVQHYRSQVQVLREALDDLVKRVDLEGDDFLREYKGGKPHALYNARKALAATEDKWGE